MREPRIQDWARSASSAAKRVAIAPDSFKGSVSAATAARYIAQGWKAGRAHDAVTLLPQADGGEGTLEALAQTQSGVLHSVGVTGPDQRPTTARWLGLQTGSRAIVELAESSGITKMLALDPLRATTFGLGESIMSALAAGFDSLTIALGGSASTDGGAGALQALGLRLLDSQGRELPFGGGSLEALHKIDSSNLIPPPSRGVLLLSDVDSPLLGATGAAAVFGPQKGASAQDVAMLERGLERLAKLLGGDPWTPGSGAAGGAAYGLAASWGARITKGSAAIAAQTGLDHVLRQADVLILGEGRFDDSSMRGKVVGNALQLATPETHVVIVAGDVDADCLSRAPRNVVAISLSEIAGSKHKAMADPTRWLRLAGKLAAQDFPT